MSNSNFGELVKEFMGQAPTIGDLVTGTIIAIDRGEVRLDIDGLMIGVVRGDELFSESKQFSNLQVGDKAEATVVEGENENGELELSFRIAGNRLVWERMFEYKRLGTPITGRVLQANKGGLLLQVDALAGFLPVSQLNPDHYPRVPGGDKNRILDHLRQFIGTDLKVRVYDLNEAEDKFILSEKAVWEDEQKNILEQYKIGDRVEGEISALTPFGAFLKFGDGLEGLIHISEIVWQRIDHPRDVLQVGDRVKAQIIDLNRSKIYLSLKRLVEDPWKTVKDRYKVGQIVAGAVHKVEPFGLMVKLDEEIHGLAHISDLSDKPMFETSVFLSQFKVGETRQFEIISMEPAEHRLGLRLEGVSGTRRGPTRTSNAESNLESSPESNIEIKPSDQTLLTEKSGEVAKFIEAAKSEEEKI